MYIVDPNVIQAYPKYKGFFANRGDAIKVGMG